MKITLTFNDLSLQEVKMLLSPSQATAPGKDVAEEPVEEPAEEKPARQRKRSSQGEGTQRRRPGRPKKEPEPEPEEEDDEISDEDLMKACSRAGKAITPAGVREIIEAYGVGDNVRDLTQEQRLEFIDTLDQEVEDAK